MALRPLTGDPADKGVKVKKKRITHIPSPQYPLLIPMMKEITLLDTDFDDIDEQVIFEPPVYATRRCGGRLTRMDPDEEADDD